MKLKQSVRLFLALFASVCAVFLLTGCTARTNDKETESADEGLKQSEVVISFNYQKQFGFASNQFAVWIEDINGNHVKTLYATFYTAKGGYLDRPESIPMWVAKFDLENRSEDQVDAITSATPGSGRLEYFWDLTDEDGDPVALGTVYRYVVEGSLRWKNHVRYLGTITPGSDPVVTEAEAEYSFEASSGQEALTKSAEEIKMLGSVTAEYNPDPGE